MLSTLFHVPPRIDLAGVSFPLFGWGVLLGVWAVAALALLGWTARQQGWIFAAKHYGLPLLLLGGMIIWGLPFLDDGSGVPIRGYGVMLLLAAATGTWLAAVRCRPLGIETDAVLSLATEMFVAGIIGARVFYVIEYHDQFFPAGRSIWAAVPDILNVAAGGLVVFGSLPTAGLAAWYFARRRGIPLLALADAIIPAMLVGLAIGRVGCFLNGCCFGGVCDLPWAVQFPAGSPPWFDQVSRGLLPGDAALAPHSLSVHPAQLYAAVDAGLLAAIAVWFTPFARRDGEVLALVLTLHPISRFLLEWIRVDEPPALGTPLSIGQLVSIGLLAAGFGLWIWLGSRPLRRFGGAREVDREPLHA
jgi:phosphatidylglycerol:prolipoprotein diacylglycerol transferase